jgi:hypothetical protein
MAAGKEEPVGESGSASALIRQAVNDLFNDAQKNGAFDYTLSLVRVGGIESGRDALLRLRDALPEPLESFNLEDLSAWYCSLAVVEDPLALLANLLHCAAKQPFVPFPFTSLIRGEFPDLTRPSQVEKVAYVVRLAQDAGRANLASAIAQSYPEAVVKACGAVHAGLEEHVLREASAVAHEFWRYLVDQYFAARLAFQGMPRVHKWPQFEVLELLTDDGYGLFGFRVYFSNGSHAYYARYPDHTEGLNLVLRESISFMVGELEALKPEWHVGDKWLYEVGLPGRYNPLGKWKPIIYEGPTGSITRRAQELSDNLPVQGILFYMMCTGHKVIEFVVRTTLDLPVEKAVAFGSTVHPVNLWKCPEATGGHRNLRIYDGWVNLETGSVEEIEEALFRVAVALNRLAFTFGVALDWQLKYSGVIEHTGMGLATPPKEDLPFLDRVLVDLPHQLDQAVDWYNRGRASVNPFAAFLCCFVAFEIIATAAYESEVDLGVQVSKDPPATRRVKRARCIEAKHSELFDSDPTQFVIEAYFQCVDSLSQRRQKVAELVFGMGHPHLSKLFERDGDEPSLSDIRNYIAHGTLSLVNRDQAALVRRRLPEIAIIVKEFLLRLALRLKPTDAVPDWSGEHRIAFSLSDPRNTKVASTDEMLPQTDWSIRPEWCE